MKNKKEAVKTTSFFGAEGGIRTHAPFRTNGFQDRLVMTASIPLRLLLNNINTAKIICQEIFQKKKDPLKSLSKRL